MMRLTKLDMARVIVTALHNLPELARADHPKAVKLAARGNLQTLTRQHKLAMAAIESRSDPTRGRERE